MKANFCTLFNSAYLSRGLVLYHSLLKCCPDFHLYVFAFDDKCRDHLRALALPHMTVISLQEFEDKDLLRVKPTRTAGEYCWTCTSSTILYCIRKFNLDHCTYIDADMYFYSDPRVLLEEMGNDSVLITEHRYSPEYEQGGTAGKYCVQFITFKNNSIGMEVLEWWRNACIDWCYARHEDGKFGDQKYLEDWTTRYKGVHELQHLGGGIAPWNVQQYEFEGSGLRVQGKVKGSGKMFDAVFYHFHALKFYDEGIVSLSDEGYEISDGVIDLFYKPYVKELISYDPHVTAGPSPFGDSVIGNVVKHYVKGVKSSKKNLLGKGLAERLRNRYFYKIDDLLK